VRQHFDGERWHNFNPLHHARKEMKAFTLDASLKITANNHRYLYKNQTKLRAESYSGLIDYLDREAHNRNMQPGRVIILPSTAKVLTLT
jgi:hypothetical protein